MLIEASVMADPGGPPSGIWLALTLPQAFRHRTPQASGATERHHKSAHTGLILALYAPSVTARHELAKELSTLVAVTNCARDTFDQLRHSKEKRSEGSSHPSRASFALG